MTPPTYEQAVAAAKANPLPVAPSYDEYLAYCQRLGVTGYTAKQWATMGQLQKTGIAIAMQRS